MSLTKACPECDSARLSCRSRSEESYRCMDCGLRFSDPVVRRRRGEGKLREDTVAATLDELDPDVLPDGGTTQQHDAIDEVLARDRLPIAYRGEVSGTDIRVLGYVGGDGPALETQVVWYEDPDANPVPGARYTVGVASAVDLVDAIEEFARSYGLDEEDGGEQR